MYIAAIAAPSILPIFLFLAKIRVTKLTTINIARSLSEAKLTSIGCIVPETPIINSILKIFEPTTFPTASPFSPLREATIEVTSSGRDVPIATTVSPIRVA